MILSKSPELVVLPFSEAILTGRMLTSVKARALEGASKTETVKVSNPSAKPTFVIELVPATADSLVTSTQKTPALLVSLEPTTVKNLEFNEKDFVYESVGDEFVANALCIGNELMPKAVIAINATRLNNDVLIMQIVPFVNRANLRPI